MDTVLNQEMLDRILTNGYSRIPVLKDGNPSLVIGILLAKSLIGVKGSANRTVLQLYKEKRI
jgi:CBS domain containing-hemolysin-like protein